MCISTRNKAEWKDARGVDPVMHEGYYLENNVDISRGLAYECWQPCCTFKCIICDLCGVFVTVVVLENLNSALQKQESLASNDKVRLNRPS